MNRLTKKHGLSITRYDRQTTRGTRMVSTKEDHPVPPPKKNKKKKKRKGKEGKKVLRRIENKIRKEI